MDEEKRGAIERLRRRRAPVVTAALAVAGLGCGSAGGAQAGRCQLSTQGDGHDNRPDAGAGRWNERPDPSWSALLGASCHPTSVASARGSGGGDTQAAIDGDLRTMWNSGGYAPQEITLDLGAVRQARGVLGVAAMTPAGEVTHSVETSEDGTTFAPGLQVTTTLGDGQIVDLRFRAPIRARWLRVRSVRSPSWIAWWELIAVECAPGAATSARVP